jgi:uncharacterized protein YfdQ (DUF2303 family)
MPPEEPQTEASAIIRSVEEKAPVHVTPLGLDAHGEDQSVLVVKRGFDVFDMKPFLDEYLTAPERRKGTATFSSLQSFVHHATRFADEDSALFCDDNPKTPSLTSVLDYHRKGAKGSPQFTEHRGVYRFPLSDEWKAWNARNGVQMSQTDFARFIEDRLVDIADPAGASPEGSAVDWANRVGAKFASPSRILELSRGLHVHVKSQVRNEGRLESGEAQIMFASSHEDINGRPLDVPSAMLLAIPVFRLGPLYPVPVRLRYRVDGTILWHFELARVDAVFENAIDGACTEASSGTNLPLFRGSPES